MALLSAPPTSHLRRSKLSRKIGTFWPKALMAHSEWRFGQRKQMRFLKGFLVLGMCTTHRGMVGFTSVRSCWDVFPGGYPWASSLTLGRWGNVAQRGGYVAWPVFSPPAPACKYPSGERALAFRGHPARKTPLTVWGLSGFVGLVFMVSLGVIFVLFWFWKWDLISTTPPFLVQILGAFLFSRASLIF